MSLWRLEWLRLFRTRRWLALLAIFLFFGVIGPLSARYLGEIVERFGGEIQVTVPEPLPIDGIVQYVSGAFQLGLLVAVIVAAGALAVDAEPEIGVFFRTRVRDMRQILAPRYVVSTVAVVAAFVAGALAAWYETWVLLGALPVGGMLAGLTYGAVYLAFAVAVVAAAAAVVRTMLATVLVSLVVLLILPVIGIVPVIGEFLPSYLVGAIDGVVRGEAVSEFLRAAAVTLVATVALLFAATWAAARRELDDAAPDGHAGDSGPVGAGSRITTAVSEDRSAA